jgi:hypothetical protein
MEKIFDILKDVPISDEIRKRLLDYEKYIERREIEHKKAEALLREINLKTRHYIETRDKIRDKTPKALSRMKLTGI